MKKIFGVFIIFVATFLLTACGGSRELDFRSVLDVDSDTMLSLGDSLSRFEDALGSGTEVDMYIEIDADISRYAFVNGVLEVVFINDQAVSISQTTESTRFQFSDMSFDMTSDDIAGRFSASDYSLDFMTFYQRFYDSRGREVGNRLDADYVATIVYRQEDDVLGDLFGEGITQISISTSDW